MSRPLPVWLKGTGIGSLGLLALPVLVLVVGTVFVNVSGQRDIATLAQLGRAHPDAAAYTPPTPAVPPVAERDLERAVAIPRRRLRVGALQDQNLLAQGQVLQERVAAGAQEVTQGVEQESQHGRRIGRPEIRPRSNLLFCI